MGELFLYIAVYGFVGISLIDACREEAAMMRKQNEIVARFIAPPEDDLCQSTEDSIEVEE